MLIPSPPKHAHTHSTHDTCEYHKKHPGDKSWAGCTCSSSYSMCENITCPEAELKLKEDAAGEPGLNKSF